MPLFVNEVRNGSASCDKDHSTANKGSSHVLRIMPAHLPLFHIFC